MKLQEDFDLFDCYLDDIGDSSLLTADEEKQLFVEFGAAGPEDKERIRDKIAEANLRLVISIARRYKSPYSIDLVSEGNIGLIKAIDKFDYRRGNRFSTYATWWIRQTIGRAIDSQTRTIRLPVHKAQLVRTLYKTSSTLMASLGREPTVAELADALGWKKKQVISTLAASDLRDVVSLDEGLSDDPEGACLVDMMTDDDQFEQQITQNELAHSINCVLSTLKPKEEKIIKMRFGFDDGRQYTLEELGQKFNLTRERIRQIEAEALRKLRRPRRARQLREFAEEGA